MKRVALFLLATGLACACGGGGSSTDTGVPDTSDIGGDSVDVPEEIVARQCTTSSDCKEAALGDAGQCNDWVCDEADWTCKRAPKDEGTQCSDGDPCTKGDACDAAGECVAGADECECRVTEDCAGQENGDLCDGTLKCDLSSLPYRCILDTTTVIACSHADDTQCATTACVPATGKCELLPVDDGTACDDGDVCSDPDTCQAGECKGTDLGCECEDDLDCLPYDDGNLCTGYTVCDKTDLPYACIVAPGSVVTCPTGQDEDCQKNGCDPETGNCQMGPVPVGSPCDDNNFCTSVDACGVDPDTGEGVCKGGVPRDCDDSNVCTNDGCDKIGQKCTHIFNNGPCEDYDKCHGGDMCQFGMCQGGTTPVDCNDNNACTADSCVTAEGCRHVMRSCDDGDACTVDDCDAATGSCTYKPYLCGDGDLCTTDACVPGQGCVFTPKDCSDGDLCTTDACVADNGACTHAPVVCADADPCTVEACDPATGLCAYPAKVCDDADLCTADGCDPATGDCTFAAVAVDDADACTADACDAATGAITHTARDCSDGDLCTADTCDPATGECANPPTVCDDGNPCTVDACSQGNGECVYDATGANNTPCDDGFDFTSPDACADGTCSGPVTVPPTLFRVAALQVEAPSFVADLGSGPVELNANLGTLATSLLGPDGYGESLLAFSPLPTDFAFGGGSLALGRGACLYDTGVATHCGLLPGEAPAQATPVAFSDAGACSDDPSVAGPCYRAPRADGAPLSLPVFDVQTVTFWSTGAFDGTGPVSIQTLDGWLLAFVASTELAALRLVDASVGLDLAALDALAHLSPDVLDGVDGYWLRLRFSAEVVDTYPAGQGCNAAGAVCDDASACTTDACDALTAQCAFMAKDCGDGDACTTDACDPATGDCSNLPTDCDDGDLCTADSCDPATGISAHVPRDCDDQNGCTTDSCDPATGNCLNVVAWTDDGDPCTVDACDPATGLVTAPPKDCADLDLCTLDSCDATTGDCLNVPNTCDDQVACTVDSCDPATGGCLNVAKVCDDGNGCTTDACDSGTGECGFATLPDTTPCDDGDAKTLNDACTGGVCAGAVPLPKFLRSRQVRWITPELVWTAAPGGAQVVTDAVGLQATKAVAAGTFESVPVPMPLFGVSAYAVGYASDLLLGFGTCDDAAAPPVITCTPDTVTFPPTSAPIATWATTGNCVDVPAVASPCFSTGATPMNPVLLFGATAMYAISAWFGADLGPDPYDTVDAIDAVLFLPYDTGLATRLWVSDTDSVPIGELLSATPPEVVNGVTGWWLRVQYVTEPFGILGQP